MSLECSPKCKSCSSLKVCLSCIETRILKGDNCVCDLSYFESGNVCQACPSTCLNCEQNKEENVECSICMDPLKMVLPKCECSSGYYLDNKLVC